MNITKEYIINKLQEKMDAALEAKTSTVAEALLAECPCEEMDEGAIKDQVIKAQDKKLADEAKKKNGKKS